MILYIHHSGLCCPLLKDIVSVLRNQALIGMSQLQAIWRPVVPILNSSKSIFSHFYLHYAFFFKKKKDERIQDEHEGEHIYVNISNRWFWFRFRGGGKRRETHRNVCRGRISYVHGLHAIDNQQQYVGR